jgi:toxin secretion/phage lysis holin
MERYIIVACFILFDIITGLAKALYKEGINSTALRKGLFHKLSEALAVIASSGIEFALKYIELPNIIPIANMVIIYLCLMEGISIIENICVMNPSLAKFFAPYLEKLKSSKEQMEKKEEE